MRKGLPTAPPTEARRLLLAALAALAFLVPAAARANANLDRRFSLEGVAHLRAWDNVDGLFGDYVAEAYNEYFKGQSRFRVHPLGEAERALAKSKLEYRRIIEDRDILGQVARATGAESLIRTKVYKEGARYRFVIDWLHSPRMDLLATGGFMLDDPGAGAEATLGGQALRDGIKGALDGVIAAVPFRGQVTGRDAEWVTVNLGTGAAIKRGDVLEISTIEEVKRHPLLNQIVGWEMARVGRVVVDDVDSGIAFCKVLEEETGRKLGRFQKITNISTPVAEADAPEAPGISADGATEIEMPSLLDEPPKLGFAKGDLWLGSFGREYTDTGGTAKTGSGFLIGAKVDGEIWINREFFAQVGLGYATFPYSQENIGGGAEVTGASGNVSRLQFDLGYMYLPSSELFGPKAWVKAGYHAYNYHLPISGAEFIGPASFGGLFLGVGGELPIRDNFGALMTFDLGLFSGVTETGFTSGTADTATDVSFFLGGYYRLRTRLSVRAGIEVVSHGADFTGGVSLTQRVVSFGPSVVYYF